MPFDSGYFSKGIVLNLIIAIMSIWAQDFTGIDGFAVLGFGLIGVMAFRAGWHVRHRLREQTGGPLYLLWHPLTPRWPMWQFDLWTLGVVGLIGTFFLTSQT
ncbi:hypothetical protein [Aliiroseovarius sp.]|uniref:hypothetical protein n=1 Tax=Aliiroseovarius sp. TaxID=1872442 RepID=UPI003BACBCAC